MELTVGSAVHVVEFGGKVLERKVLEDTGEHVVICPHEEYLAARREGRKPIGIRFPKSSLTVRSY